MSYSVQMDRIQVNAEMLRWARDRSGLDEGVFARAFPHFEAWEHGDKLPTLKQLQAFAKKTYTPFGYLFLEQPPAEPLPIADLRIGRDTSPARPSPHLLDTVYRCQQRQDWYRSYADSTGQSRVSLPVVDSRPDTVTSAAGSARHTLSFDVAERQAQHTWSDALSLFRQRVEDAGVLITINGVVGNNTHRKLDPDEFRGFALVDNDKLAPLIFVNGADTKAAQMFTIAHELAHLLIGKEGLSDADPATPLQLTEESWCNSFAGEFLVPRAHLEAAFNPSEPVGDEMQRLATQYKVSTLVVLRRLRDLGAILEDRYWDMYNAELARLKEYSTGSDTTGGGSFYSSQRFRVGERFARALITSTLEGETTYTEALQLLDFSRVETLHSYARRLGFNL